MIIKWETGGWYEPGVFIQRVECVRETEKCVWIRRGGKDRRTDKRSLFNDYHDSWEDAHQHVIEKAQAELMSAKYAVNKATQKLEQISMLTKPEDA